MNTLQFPGQKKNNNYKKKPSKCLFIPYVIPFSSLIWIGVKTGKTKKNNWLFANIRATFEEEKNYLRIDVSMRHEKLGSCLMYIHERYTPWC